MYKWVVGDLVFDKNRPDGNPRRLLDSRKISSIRFQQLSYRGKHFPEQSPVKGAWKDQWRARTSLDEGLRSTWDKYLGMIAKEK